jgi:hypothetical protein
MAISDPRKPNQLSADKSGFGADADADSDSDTGSGDTDQDTPPTPLVGKHPSAQDHNSESLAPVDTKPTQIPVD